MMQLTDFSKCIEFIRLKEKMGVTTIPVLPRVKFTREVIHRREIEEPNQEAIQIEEKLKKGTITVNVQEIIPDSEGLLTHKGRKVVAYIRDQRRGIDSFGSQYRYHLYDCSTLQQMRAEGRLTRYFITKRNDGLFLVHDLSGYGVQKRELELELCQNCIRELSYRQLYFSPFSLKKYFDKHDSKVPKTIKKVITETEIQSYTPDQEDLSREYRKAANYHCQSCDVDCSDDPSLLHLHHIDGNPSNNKHENFRVLCVDCHSKQSYHSQVSNPQKAKQQIREIQGLRHDQGIPELFMG